MITFLIRRLLLALLVAFVVSIVSFALLRMSGDLASALAGPEATAQEVQRIRVQYGLDLPLYQQYLSWLGDAVRGDLGHSLFYRASVWSLVVEHIPVTLKLSVLGILVALGVAIPAGVLSATYANTWIDRVALWVSVTGQALPNFFFALMMMYVFAVMLRLLPVSGGATWKHYVMPAIVLGFYQMPSILRVTRAGMLDVLESDYIRTAWAKGLSARSVLFKHALRNAVIPVVALTAVNFGHMLSGSVVIETVFALPGLGYLAYESIFRVDFPVVQALLLVVSMLYLLMVVISDVVNAWLDPRIRVS